MMDGHFHIVDAKPANSSDTYLGELDGIKSLNVSSFLTEIAAIFKFPDYFGKNYDALDECINDLSWIDLPNYILYIKNYNVFLSEEDYHVKLETLTLFRDTSIAWANVPNFEGEEDFRRKADFKIYVERCAEIEVDLKALP